MGVIKKATAVAVVSAALAVPTAAFAVEAGTTAASVSAEDAVSVIAPSEVQELATVGGEAPSAPVTARSNEDDVTSSEADTSSGTGEFDAGPSDVSADDDSQMGATHGTTPSQTVSDAPDASEGSVVGLAGSGSEGTALGEDAERPSAIVPEGVFEISVRDGSNRKNLDVRAASDQDAADVDVFDDNSTKAQRFRISRVEDTEYSVIYNVGSGKVLDVACGEAAAGAKVWQYAYNGTSAQRWRVVDNGDGSYTFLSALRSADGGALALDVRYGLLSNGSPLQLWSANGTVAQRWYLESPRTVEDGVYGIASSLSGDRSLDIDGSGMSAGTNAQIWGTNSSTAQRFNVRYDERTGYYTIKNIGSGKVLDVSGASHESGANVWQYDENGTWAQAWSIEGQDDGSYRIVSANSGLALDVSGGSSTDGANVQQYAPNGSTAQKWVLERRGELLQGRYTIHTSGDTAYVLDDATGSREVGANVQLWRDNGSAAQQFELVRYGDEGYYVVRNVRNGGYLTLTGTEQGSNALQWLAGEQPEDSQLWKATLHWDGFGLLSRSGLALDVNGAVFGQGTNVQGYNDNASIAQRFWLRTVGAASLGITNVGATVSTQEGAEERILSTLVADSPYLFLPSCADLSQTVLTAFVPGRGGFYASATRDDAGMFVKAGAAIDLVSGGFVRDGDGAYRVFLRLSEGDAPLLIHVMRSANVPALFLTSDDPFLKGRSYVESSADHSLKSEGSMVLAEADGTVTYDGRLDQIKGRGNSTWLAEKKPYQIKLDKKASLVDGTKGNKAKKWLLLANFYDQTLLHQFVAARTGLAMGLVSTPDCRTVDLYYDGEYRGTYLLSEKVEVGKGRVEIDEIENDSVDDVSVESHPTAYGTNSYGREYRYVTGVKAPADLSGGYLLELDNGYYASERSWFDTSIGHFVLKSPEDASEKQVRYISERVQAAIDSARSGDAGAGFDVTSLARVFLVEEFAKNSDYIRHSSTYFYKDKGEDLVYAGPIWDFDQGFGVSPWNVGMGYESPEGFASEHYEFFLGDPAVRQEIKREFNERLKPYVEGTLLSDKDGGAGLVERTAEGIVRTARMDGLLWDRGDADDFLARALQMREWIARRIAWMDATINAW